MALAGEAVGHQQTDESRLGEPLAESSHSLGSATSPATAVDDDNAGARRTHDGGRIQVGEQVPISRSANDDAIADD